MKKLIILAVIGLAVWYVFFRKTASGKPLIDPIKKDEPKAQTDPINDLIQPTPLVTPAANLVMSTGVTGAFSQQTIVTNS